MGGEELTGVLVLSQGQLALPRVQWVHWPGDPHVGTGHRQLHCNPIWGRFPGYRTDDREIIGN